jgi:uncharacterized protein
VYLITKNRENHAAWTFLLSAGADVIGAQNTSKDLPPIIDVHHHAMDNDNGFSMGPTCPNTSKFTASDPKTDAGQQSGWATEECTPKLYPTAKSEYIKDVLAEMERLNVTARGIRRSCRGKEVERRRP